MPILDRLVGLETEYAIRFRPREGVEDPPSRFRLYQALMARVKRHVLTAPARHFKEGMFLANGGAIWFEAERPAAGGGLIEGSTPECRGPREVLRYQRAQDQLLSQCARLADVGGHMSLVKNDRDSDGHVYGAQENYEVQLGTSWSLWMWRIGLILLIPLLLFTWLGIGLMIGGILIYLAWPGSSTCHCNCWFLIAASWLWCCSAATWWRARRREARRRSGWRALLLWMTRVVSGPLGHRFAEPVVSDGLSAHTPAVDTVAGQSLRGRRGWDGRRRQ